MIYIMTFNATHSILERIVLCFGVQREDIIEHTNDKCHVFTFSVYNARFYVYMFYNYNFPLEISVNSLCGAIIK